MKLHRVALCCKKTSAWDSTRVYKGHKTVQWLYLVSTKVKVPLSDDAFLYKGGCIKTVRLYMIMYAYCWRNCMLLYAVASRCTQAVLGSYSHRLPAVCTVTTLQRLSLKLLFVCAKSGVKLLPGWQMFPGQCQGRLDRLPPPSAAVTWSLRKAQAQNCTWSSPAERRPMRNQSSIIIIPNTGPIPAQYRSNMDQCR